MAYRNCVALADATQGGISLDAAMQMPNSQLVATLEIVQEMRRQQQEQMKKA